jgi:ABC-type branched-subunit amino acid transport system substrate-binding protein
MERAARMALGEAQRDALAVFDTRGTAQGAEAAAKAARRARSDIVIGPVHSAEVPAVLAVIGTTVPVLTFSNNAALSDNGAFLFGITARQVALGVLRFAASRGIRRIAVSDTHGDWGMQLRDAAIAAGADLGIEVAPVMQERLSALVASGDVAALPDAVLMADAESHALIAPRLSGAGVQLLGGFQAIDFAPDILLAFEGAWLAAPDPAAFAGFARAFEQANGSRPGIIAGLAYDALGIVRQLRMGGGTDRSALTTASSFKGVCGEVRFRGDGSVARALAVLAVDRGRLRKVAEGSVS